MDSFLIESTNTMQHTKLVLAVLYNLENLNQLPSSMYYQGKQSFQELIYCPSHSSDKFLQCTTKLV